MFRIVATAYEREYGSASRVLSFAKVFIFSPSSAMVTCPFAMTDGVAKLNEIFGPFEATGVEVYERLTSRDPEFAWTSGQWMTERPGGSDVSNTETVAVRNTNVPGEKQYKVSGFKWFSSATDSQVTALLAKAEGDDGRLSCFLGKIDTQNGTIKINRLKKKFGTVAVPTAELELKDMEVELVGPLGRGVATISTVLNITRLYSAVGSLSFMRRALNICREYSLVRSVFGQKLYQIPSHVKILAHQEVLGRGLLFLNFYACKLMGEQEVPDNILKQKLERQEQLLRVIPGVCKALTCKVAIGSISECMEALGGIGYLEHDVDLNIARLLRDAQVNPIWEGTTNTLASDFIRHIQKHGSAFISAVEDFLGDISSEQQVPAVTTMPVGTNPTSSSFSSQKSFLLKLTDKNREDWENIKSLIMNTSKQEQAREARELMMEFGRIFTSAILISYAGQSRTLDSSVESAIALETAARWTMDDLSRSTLTTNTKNQPNFYKDYKRQVNESEYFLQLNNWKRIYNTNNFFFFQLTFLDAINSMLVYGTENAKSML